MSNAMLNMNTALLGNNRERERGRNIGRERERERREGLFTFIIEENMLAMPNLNRVGKTKSKLASFPLRLDDITDFAKSCRDGM